jgi:hypothetical protein
MHKLQLLTSVRPELVEGLGGKQQGFDKLPSTPLRTGGFDKLSPNGVET